METRMSARIERLNHRSLSTIPTWVSAIMPLRSMRSVTGKLVIWYGSTWEREIQQLLEEKPQTHR
jgi:hypothetical protein